ncbi:transcriptional regulator, LysR family [Shewanella halifaxensis HAW-EB4]|uniref:Transcriptional regulator, LysR family n=1 Tax=Shewanella halifaxensis (strain HAW-EB4) TaxID=458817 RepID=B0TNX1_SHEHH|nr:LysR family transcriptional regulator [Shewanella halifaxensis]ABZ74874.1 transcriptional regulator, LysR family [Shewanella halifaxensis HAW-EB4]
MRKELSKLDYFTLKVFIGLVEFKNGSVVAQKLDTTQPKVSRALSNMREVIHDELFVRRQYGVEPNIMADKLYPIAKSIVQAYEQMADVTAQLPEKNQLIIAAQEHLAGFLVDSISEVCQRQGLEISVSIQAWSDNVQELLAQGKIDYAITVNSTQSESVRNFKIGDVKNYFLAARKAHPFFDKEVSLSRLLENKLVFINYAKVGLIEHWFERYTKDHSLDIKMSFKTTSLAMALNHVAKTDDICWTASIFSYLYFNSRSDIDYIDVTDFYEKVLFPNGDFASYSYYLQYHQSHDNDFSTALSKLLQQSLALAQEQYEQQSMAN